jgi:hypothetical protein
MASPKPDRSDIDAMIVVDRPPLASEGKSRLMKLPRLEPKGLNCGGLSGKLKR